MNQEDHTASVLVVEDTIANLRLLSELLGAQGYEVRAVTNGRQAIQAVERAGGTILRRGEFCPGEPYVFFHDLDGYEVEIWYELPTPVDPPARHA